MQEVYDSHYKKLAEEFRKHLKTMGYADAGVNTKYRNILEFLSKTEQSGIHEISALSTADIENYHNYLRARPSKKDGSALSVKTVNTHLKGVEQFFMMLIKKKKISKNPARNLKLVYPPETGERTVLTQNEIKQLYQVCESHRERAILSLAYGCGLRSGELAAINIDDVKLRQQILIVPKGKGNKRRVVPMSRQVVKDLENYYFKEREILTTGRDFTPGTKAFMLHSRGGRLQKYTYNKYLKIIIKRTQNPEIIAKNISIHNLRHSIATHLLRQGVKLEQVRDFLGHSQLETTEIYTRVSKTQLEKLIK